jgi:hypothetical protein
MSSVPTTAFIDPDTGALVTTRDDNTTTIQYKSGDFLILWPDGSRLTKWADSSWTVEVEGMPAVRGDPNGVSLRVTHLAQMQWNCKNYSLALLQDSGPCAVAVSGIVCCGVYQCDP